ncbi:hypothetical protein CBR_g28499 [Chara braunii]|uniref:Uncharacterized protein n=1 Tax=Chara braunii TaxID=69332 RepID=A0A388JW85_CHABU|nr:hypothetical protein CBR_g28499 [Chara braunii]|eukprot:GBG62023.1 hypothetical protein CBR_g28499 [Chara braunii]
MNRLEEGQQQPQQKQQQQMLSHQQEQQQQQQQQQFQVIDYHQQQQQQQQSQQQMTSSMNQQQTMGDLRAAEQAQQQQGGANVVQQTSSAGGVEGRRVASGKDDDEYSTLGNLYLSLQHKMFPSSLALAAAASSMLPSIHSAISQATASFSLWVFPTKGTKPGPLVFSGADRNIPFLSFDVDHRIVLNALGRGKETCTSKCHITLQKWTHIGCEMERNRVRLLINGVEEGECEMDIFGLLQPGCAGPGGEHVPPPPHPGSAAGGATSNTPSPASHSLMMMMATLPTLVFVGAPGPNGSAVHTYNAKLQPVPLWREVMILRRPLILDR